MSAYNNDKNQDLQSMTAKNNQALQSALDDAEQALAGDPLQEAVQQKKNEQQFK